MSGFATPQAWPWLLFALGIAGLLFVADQGRRWARAAWIGPREPELASEVDDRRRVLERGLAGLVLLLAGLALMQPLGPGERPRAARGPDLVLCLDVSRSMLARDLPPDRVEAARNEVRALMQRARGDRLGLVAFAGEARLVSPLTSDLEALGQMLAATDPWTIERGGTDLGAAIDVALEALGADPRGKAIALLTDGDDRDGRGLRAAQRCAALGVRVHAVGLGSPQGSKVVVREETDDGNASESFLRDRSGREVISALDVLSLRRIAETTGGELVRAGAEPGALARLHETRLVPDAQRHEESQTPPSSWFQAPLLLAVALGLLEAVMRERRSP